MLSLAEELFLLALDERAGTLKPLPTLGLEYALAGAVLMDLALLNRIDTDVNSLFVVDPTPTGNPLLDDALRELAARPGPRRTADCLHDLSGRGKQIQARVLARLTEQGIVTQSERRILWVLPVRRYRVLDDRDVAEARTRLRELILSDGLPDPRDAVLISLADACALFDDMFSPEERERARPRIARLVKLDLVGQAVAKSLRQIAYTMNMTAPALP